MAIPVFILSMLVVLLGLARAEDGCPERDFLGCVTQLRIQRVPFDKNMLNVVFNVTSEAKLLHTCKAYSDVLPCFRDRIVRCGNEKQRRMLDEVRRMIMFFCSPFSMQRQKEFVKHGPCIGRVLQMPASTNCYMDAHPLGQEIQTCREDCYQKKEFLCMMKIWISEQSLCTMIDIEKECGKDATKFYTELQFNVFETKFPIICDLPDGNATTSRPRPTEVDRNGISGSSETQPSTYRPPVNVNNNNINNNINNIGQPARPWSPWVPLQPSQPVGTNLIEFPTPPPFPPQPPFQPGQWPNNNINNNNNLPPGQWPSSNNNLQPVKWSVINNINNNNNNNSDRGQWGNNNNNNSNNNNNNSQPGQWPNNNNNNNLQSGQWPNNNNSSSNSNFKPGQWLSINTSNNSQPGQWPNSNNNHNISQPGQWPNSNNNNNVQPGPWPNSNNNNNISQPGQWPNNNNNNVPIVPWSNNNNNNNNVQPGQWPNSNNSNNNVRPGQWPNNNNNLPSGQWPNHNNNNNVQPGPWSNSNSNNNNVQPGQWPNNNNNLPSGQWPNNNNNNNAQPGQWPNNNNNYNSQNNNNINGNRGIPNAGYQFITPPTTTVPSYVPETTTDRWLPWYLRGSTGAPYYPNQQGATSGPDYSNQLQSRTPWPPYLYPYGGNDLYGTTDIPMIYMGTPNPLPFTKKSAFASGLSSDVRRDANRQFPDMSWYRGSSGSVNCSIIVFLLSFLISSFYLL